MLPTLVAQLDGSDSSGGDGEIAEVLPSGLSVEDWVIAGAILIGAIVVGRIIQAISQRLLARFDSDLPIATMLAHAARNVVILGGIVYALASLGVQIGPLLGALGIGGLAIAFAAQTILENTFASVILRIRHDVNRGDQVTVADVDGEVEDITMRVVVLKTFSGERALVPSAQVLNAPIINHTANGSRRTTLSVGVTYDTDLRLAHQVLTDAVHSVSQVWKAPAPEIWVEQFGESSIDFALRFWHAPDNRDVWSTRSAVAMEVKQRLDAADITIPFPQRTLSFLEPPPADADPFAASG